MKPNISEEFEFIKDKIFQAAKRIAIGEYVEATWMLGCLHTVCEDDRQIMIEREKNKDKLNTNI